MNIIPQDNNLTRKSPLFFSKRVLLVIFAILLGAAVYTGAHLHQVAKERTEIKEAHSQLNSFTYGLLSADAWKEIMRNIVAQKVSNFQFTEDQKKFLEEKTVKILDQLLITAEKVLNRRSSELGKIKTHFARSYITTARKNTSEFAKNLNKQLQDPATLEKLKEFALDQFDAFAATTHNNPEHQRIFLRLLTENNALSVPEFNQAASRTIADMDRQSRYHAVVMAAIVLVFLLGWRYVLGHPELERPFFIYSAVMGLVLLATSLSIPMMEIDARIGRIDLKLIGESVQFDEQVIYYRSKSLMQVVWLLVKNGKIESILVGVLLVVFSVVFPVTKLITGVIYLRGKERFNRLPIVQFFAFNSAKWSMVDVFVVAIFMSYIGFQSILRSQLSNLNVQTGAVQSVTTNHSSMQAGFILFTVFVLYNMVLSEMLKKISKSNVLHPLPNDRAPQLASARESE
jgi:hypothetical protein